MRWCACSACAVVHDEHAAVATTKSLPHHEAQPVLENLRAHVRSLAQCEHNARARRDVAHDSAERQPRPPRHWRSIPHELDFVINFSKGIEDVPGTRPVARVEPDGCVVPQHLVGASIVERALERQKEELCLLWR